MGAILTVTFLKRFQAIVGNWALDMKIGLRAVVESERAFHAERC